MQGYQIENVLELLITSVSVLTGLWIVARAWTHRRGRQPGPDLAGLSESVRALRDSIEEMRGDLADVADRIDFTERTLARLSPPPGERQLPPR